MIKKTIFMMAALMAMTALLSGSSARKIMEDSDNLKSPDTVRSRAEMTIQKGANTLTRTIELWGKSYGKNEKVIVTVKDGTLETKILTHTQTGSDDLQWLKMPNGSVKRITTADRSGEFVNSHLFYEDLRSREIDDYEYKLIGEEQVESFQCYVIEGTAKPGKSIYDKAVFFVIKSGDFQNFIVRADIFFDGYLYKRLINYDIKITNGIITPYRSVMYRLDRTGKTLGNTEVKITGIQYNNPAVTDAQFNQDRL